MDEAMKQQTIIGKAMRDSIKVRGWRSAELNYNKASTVGDARFYVKTLLGKTIQPKVSSDAIFAFSDLKKAMATAEHGAWLSATAKIDSKGNIDFDFNYDNEPDWIVPLSEESDPLIYFEEMKLYPRPEHETPDWLKAKLSKDAPKVS